MNNNTDQFQWTDELVKDLVSYKNNFGKGFPTEKIIEDFKQLKSKTEQPLWEILSLKGRDTGNIYRKSENGLYLDQNQNGFGWTPNDKDESIKIHSVKRLSDGEVFSVGDRISYTNPNPNSLFNTIESFSVHNNQIYVNSHYVGRPDRTINDWIFRSKNYYPTNVKAPKEEQVPIKVGGIHFYTSMGESPIRDAFAVKLSGNISEDKLQSIKEAIEDVLNEDKIKHEKLLAKIESRVKLANMINTQANYLKETLDYINSLK